MRLRAFAFALGICAAFAAGSVNGFLITQWQYTVTSAFETSGVGAPVFTGGGGCPSVSALSLSWGDCPAGPPNASGPARSGLSIENTPGTGSVFTNGAPGPTDTFIHDNNVVPSGLQTLLRASIDATLTLTALAPPLGVVVPPTINTFHINFAETPNVAPCAVTSPVDCNDIFVIDQVALNFPVVVPSDATYFVSFFAAPAFAALPAAACAAAGATAPCFGFTTVEGLSNRVLFNILITSEPITLVQEPTSIALLGLGLLGLGFLRRRKSR